MEDLEDKMDGVGIRMQYNQPKEQPSGEETATIPCQLKDQTKAQRMRANIQFTSLCWAFYVSGWNDATTGPLLPRIQDVYKLNYTIVSLLFVFACIGFLTGALSNIVLDYKYGFGKVIVLGSLFQVVAYCIDATAPPFPVLVLGYAINGVGMALQISQINGFVASLQDTTKMGIVHAAYGEFKLLHFSRTNFVPGAGALSSPFVSTQFAQLPHWSFHYLVSLGIACLNTVLLIVVFRLKTQDECLFQIGFPPCEKNSNESSQFRQVFSLKTVHLLAFFILVYVGVEVTVGGWMVTYVIKMRGGGPSSGYISSGFFGGLTLGRVALLWVNQKVGERRALFIYAFLAIGLQLIVWLVPSLVGGAISVSFVGVLLGPMYPIVMNHSGRVLPGWLLTGSVGWIAGCGQAGSALLPFMTGAIASKSGIGALQPLLVSMMVLMTFIWALIPNGVRRETQ